MEREIWEIVKALDEKKLTAIEAHKKLCSLYIVSKSFYCLGDSWGEIGNGKCEKQCDDCRAKILKQ